MSATITYADTSNMFADSKKITLDKINQGGGSGGSGAITAAILAAQQVYVDRAPGTPPNTPALPAINYRSDLGSWTQWNGAAWV